MALAPHSAARLPRCARWRVSRRRRELVGDLVEALAEGRGVAVLKQRVASDPPALRAALVQALFALSRTWFASDKTALGVLERFAHCLDRFGSRLTEALARPGATAGQWGDSVREMEALCRASVGLAGDLYQSRRKP